MIDIISPSSTRISPGKNLEKHVRNLKTIYSDKSKVKDAHIWINDVNVKFGNDLNHTVRNINRSYAKSGVKASIKNGKLILTTRSDKLKIHDTNKILKTLVDKNRIGTDKYNHDIQIIRKGVGNAKFIYTFDKRKDNKLDKDFSSSSTIYYSGSSNVHLQHPQVNLENVGVVQDIVRSKALEPKIGISIHDVDPLFSRGKVATLQQDLSLENAEQSAALVPAVKFEIAKIVEDFSVRQEEEP